MSNYETKLINKLRLKDEVYTQHQKETKASQEEQLTSVRNNKKELLVQKQENFDSQTKDLSKSYESKLDTNNQKYLDNIRDKNIANIKKQANNKKNFERQRVDQKNKFKDELNSITKAFRETISRKDKEVQDLVKRQKHTIAKINAKNASDISELQEYYGEKMDEMNEKNLQENKEWARKLRSYG